MLPSVVHFLVVVYSAVQRSLVPRDDNDTDVIKASRLFAEYKTLSKQGSVFGWPSPGGEGQGEAATATMCSIALLNVQGSDTTDDDSSTSAKYITIYPFLQPIPVFYIHQ